MLTQLEDLDEQAFLYLAPVTNMVGLVHHPHFDKSRGLSEGSANRLWALEGLNLSPSVVACKPDQLTVVRINTSPTQELADDATAAEFKALVRGTEPETYENQGSHFGPHPRIPCPGVTRHQSSPSSDAGPSQHHTHLAGLAAEADTEPLEKDFALYRFGYVLAFL